MGTGASGLPKTSKFADFGGHYEALQKSTEFFHKHSNSDTWADELTDNEHKAVERYTGEGYNSYKQVNNALYNTKYEDMPSNIKEAVDDIQSGLNKFVLEKGIQVTRQCDFKIFGAKKGETMTISEIKDFIKNNADPKDGTLQQDGFLSAGANNHGASIDGWGLVITFKVPAAIGAGAYVNPISQMSGAGENEFLFNCYSRFKFDTSSMWTDSSGKIHINAIWKGRGRKQSFA